ncbi:MAG: hypothetical protein M3270_09930 [Thermoproteota archaeon]|nr:hypothetical protein [Thermoproteota archaeon]
MSMFNYLSVDRKNGVLVLVLVVVCLTTSENNKQVKEKKEYAQKEDTLQPITKLNTKLDKELQDWEVESTKGGANDAGG